MGPSAEAIEKLPSATRLPSTRLMHSLRKLIAVIVHRSFIHKHYIFVFDLLRGLGLARRRVNHGNYFQNAVGREAAAPRMFPEHVLVRREDRAVDAIRPDKALQPFGGR